MSKPDYNAALGKEHDEELGYALLTLARNAIAERLSAATAVPLAHAALEAPGASFVTLTQHGALRGCIGSLEAHRPLIRDVRENALAAAFRDPRFAPLIATELDITRIEISLLTPATALTFQSEADLLAQLRPGIDGLILSYGERRGTFLPQVWESLPERRNFLAQLKRKAGMTSDFWHADITVARYEVMKWKEPAYTETS